MSAEPTLADLLRNLTESVDEYQDVVNRMFELHSDRIDLGERISSELRDDLHAVANRVESLIRSTATPFEGGIRDDAA